MVRPSRRGRTLPLAESQWTEGVDAGGEDGIDWDTGGLDDVAAQDQWKQPVVAATTGDVTIATALNAGDTVDGVTLAAGDRVLVRAQSNDEENGIYLAGTTPERAADMDEADEVLGAIVYVIDGTANGGTVYRCDLTAAPIIDTDPITFAELSGGGSGSLTVEESDASPSVSPVDTIIVDAADFTVVDNMDGSVTLTTDEPDAAAHIADTTDAHDASAISIADAGGYFTGTDVEAALQEIGAGGGGGGGGLSGSYVGYNTVGGTWVTVTSLRQYCKQITLAGNALVQSIDAYLRPSIDNVFGYYATVLLDNAGAPGTLVAAAGLNLAYLSNNASMPGPGRWFSVAVNVYLAAGTYWICVMPSINRIDIAKDGSGSDRYFTASQHLATGAYPSSWAITTTTDTFSIRARVLT